MPTATPAPSPSQPSTILPYPTLATLADEAHVTIASQIVHYELANSTYAEVATEVANELMINGETNTSTVFSTFDWGLILDHWPTVQKDLSAGVVPYNTDLNWNPGADALIAFAKEHGMPVMAGSLLWGGDIPQSVLDGHFSASQLSEILEYIVKAEVLHYRGQIHEWFVASEVAASLLFGNSTFQFWFNNLGMQAVYDAYTWAHEADPNARLMIYEDRILDANNSVFVQIKSKLFSILQDLKARKIPLNDVGFENNFWVYAPPNEEDMVATIKQVKAMGYGIGPSQTIVSESAKDAFWPNRPRTVNSVPNLDEAQTAIYRDVFNAYLATGSPFGMYGFSDAVSEFDSGSIHIPDAKAMILNANYQPKAAYFALVDDLKAYIRSKS